MPAYEKINDGSGGSEEDEEDEEEEATRAPWAHIGIFVCGAVVGGVGVALAMASTAAMRGRGEQASPPEEALEDLAGQEWDYSAFALGDWVAKGYPDCDSTKPGNLQSPIDIPSKNATAWEGEPLVHATGGGCPAVEMKTNDHTYEASFHETGCQNLVTTWNGKNYTLLQFHFHLMSENKVDGMHYPGECHLVHKAADGSVLVVGLFLYLPEANSSGNAFLSRAFHEGFHLEHIWGVNVSNAAEWIDPYTGMLPPGGEFYYFSGSFTTPPCTGGVDWIMYKQAIPLARDAFDNFHKYLQHASQADAYAHVNRPVQPLAGRAIFRGQAS